MDNILVTGGAGFIGSNLCEHLLKRPNTKVWSLDNYSTGLRSNHFEGVNYIKGSTKDIDKLINFKPNFIFHLGEYSRVEQSFSDIKKLFDYNKLGTFSVLEFCHKTKSKLIYAGSSTKFGDGGLGRYQSPYGWTKASNTELVKNYGEWFGINYAIAYFYNAFGPREISTGKYATLIGLFAHKMRNNKSLTVVSPGTQLRNFTHIDDIISGLILVAEKGYGDNYGIGSPKSYSILDIAKMFGGTIEMIPERKGNRLSAKIITKKTIALGWSCKKSIKNYIDELKKNDFQEDC